ncbi:unnamed protein product (macronuclear) [Paramecium tetraurelia]|uniref:BRO1 domain-containing protein n=1 Tax=Paramecium tetraurelia TaxID=5888 RepID=A0CBX2_PARTE|nr:uncharacterized protein GSPATT00037072001 [Paramecium tetraurelia]CAK68289.1 unnamed protein product [Paramecium tetraurelia]|eukprot:XP_001435686.1 hypothetical protein (macronuclear) [Paramecium tetraurelia strain d4-2]
MNFGFRFKQTKAIKFPRTENQLVNKIDEYRKQITDYRWQDCNKGDVEACLQLEKLLTEYILLLDSAIDQQVKLEISFSWNDSYEPNKFTQSNQWHYEYSCSLYNLGLLYYHLGQNMPTIKDAISKSRNSQWCFQRLSEVTAFVNSRTIQQHSDLSLVHIHMHNCYAQAYGYKKLYDHFQTIKNPDELLIALGLLQESSKMYEQTIRCLIQTKTSNKKPIPPIIYNQLMERFSNDHTVTVVITNMELAKLMASTAKEVPREQRMGKAITYLNKAEQSIVELFKKFKHKNEFLLLQQQQLIALKKEYLYLNENAFKHPIAKEYELLQLPVKQDLIKARPPESFQNKWDNKQQEVHVETRKLIQEINAHKTYAQQKLLDLQNNFNQIYFQYNIQFMVDSYQNAETLKLTQSIQLKVDFIKQKGGWKGCQQQIQKIHQLQQEQGKKLINIKNQLDLCSVQKEPPTQGYQLLSQQIENFRRIVEDVQKKLLEASLINRTTEEQIKGIKEQLLFIEQNNNQMIASKMQNSLQESQNFFRKNLNTLKKLSVAVETIINKMDLIKLQLASLEKYIDDMGLDQSSNQKIDANLLLQALKMIQIKITEYDAIFASINLKDLEQIACQMEDKQEFLKLANQGEQEFEDSLKVIQEVFYNLEYAQQFYDSISQQVAQLTNVINELTNNSN